MEGMAYRVLKFTVHIGLHNYTENIPSPSGQIMDVLRGVLAGKL